MVLVDGRPLMDATGTLESVALKMKRSAQKGVEEKLGKIQIKAQRACPLKWRGRVGQFLLAEVFHDHESFLVRAVGL